MDVALSRLAESPRRNEIIPGSRRSANYDGGWISADVVPPPTDLITRISVYVTNRRADARLAPTLSRLPRLADEYV